MDRFKKEEIVFIKAEQVCRTCLIDEGHFFNISDTFDHYTLTQMIQNITNLQIDPTDGYTQSICFECVKELRKANKFRTKCLESNNVLINERIDNLKIPTLNNYMAKVQQIKQEIEESFDAGDVESDDDCKSEIPDVDIDCEDNEESPDESNELVNDFNVTGHDIAVEFEKKKFSCTICNHTSSTSNAYKRHLLKHTTAKNYKCDQCPSEFKNSSSLLRHKRVKHENLKQFACEICQREFFFSSELKDHMHVHTGERPHICHYCGKAFYIVSNLRYHISQQHEPTKTLLKCDQCDYSTKQKSVLKVHMKIHTGEKPFQCPHCPNAFSRKNHLNEHMLRHSGMKEFACDLCDYKSVSCNDVKKHRIMHTGEKPYACSVCDYRASRKHGLKRHMKTHSLEQKFLCPHCPFKTTVRNTLLKHMKKECISLKKDGCSSKSENIPSNDDIKEDTEESNE